MSNQKDSTSDQQLNGNDDPNRRDALSTASSIAMTGGLIASYGTFAFIAGKFLYSSDEEPDQWLFVTKEEDMKAGEPLSYTSPSGAKIVLTRQIDEDDNVKYVALSSVCPHLGCRVHWEAQNDRFFCPCHSAVFSKTGEPESGPPKDANPPQSLTEYPVEVRDGLIFIKVPVYSFVSTDSTSTSLDGNQTMLASDGCTSAGNDSISIDSADIESKEV